MKLTKLEKLCTPDYDLMNARCKRLSGGGTNGDDYGASKRLAEIKSLYGVRSLTGGTTPDLTVDMGHVDYVLSGGAEHIKDPEVRRLYEFYGNLPNSSILVGGAVGGMFKTRQGVAAHDAIVDGNIKHQKKAEKELHGILTEIVQSELTKIYPEYKPPEPKNDFKLSDLIQIGMEEARIKKMLGNKDPSNIIRFCMFVRTKKDPGPFSLDNKNIFGSGVDLKLPSEQAFKRASKELIKHIPTKSLSGGNYVFDDTSYYDDMEPESQSWIGMLTDFLSSVKNFIVKHLPFLICLVVAFLIIFTIIDIFGLFENTSFLEGSKMEKEYGFIYSRIPTDDSDMSNYVRLYCNFQQCIAKTLASISSVAKVRWDSYHGETELLFSPINEILEKIQKDKSTINAYYFTSTDFMQELKNLTGEKQTALTYLMQQGIISGESLNEFLRTLNDKKASVNTGSGMVNYLAGAVMKGIFGNKDQTRSALIQKELALKLYGNLDLKIGAALWVLSYTGGWTIMKALGVKFLSTLGISDEKTLEQKFDNQFKNVDLGKDMKVGQMINEERRKNIKAIIRQDDEARRAAVGKMGAGLLAVGAGIATTAATGGNPMLGMAAAKSAYGVVAPTIDSSVDAYNQMDLAQDNMREFQNSMTSRATEFYDNPDLAKEKLRKDSLELLEKNKNAYKSSLNAMDNVIQTVGHSVERGYDLYKNRKKYKAQNKLNQLNEKLEDAKLDQQVHNTERMINFQQKALQNGSIEQLCMPEVRIPNPREDCLKVPGFQEMWVASNQKEINSNAITAADVARVHTLANPTSIVSNTVVPTAKMAEPLDLQQTFNQTQSIMNRMQSSNLQQQVANKLQQPQQRQPQQQYVLSSPQTFFPSPAQPLISPQVQRINNGLQQSQLQQYPPQKQYVLSSPQTFFPKPVDPVPSPQVQRLNDGLQQIISSSQPPQNIPITQPTQPVPQQTQMLTQPTQLVPQTMTQPTQPVPQQTQTITQPTLPVPQQTQTITQPTLPVPKQTQTITQPPQNIPQTITPPTQPVPQPPPTIPQTIMQAPETQPPQPLIPQTMPLPIPPPTKQKQPQQAPIPIQPEIKKETQERSLRRSKRIMAKQIPKTYTQPASSKSINLPEPNKTKPSTKQKLLPPKIKKETQERSPRRSRRIMAKQHSTRPAALDLMNASPTPPPAPPLRRSPRINKGKRLRAGATSVKPYHYFVPLHNSRVFAKKLAEMLNYWQQQRFTHGNLGRSIQCSGDLEGSFIVAPPPSETIPYVPGQDLRSCLQSVTNDMMDENQNKNERERVKKNLGFVRYLAKHLHNKQQRQYIRDVFGDFFMSYSANTKRLPLLCRTVHGKLLCKNM